MSDLEQIIEDVAEKAATLAARRVLADCPIPRRYLSSKEASIYLSLSVDALQLWRKQGQGPPYLRVYRSIRYDVQALDSWVTGLVPGVDGTFLTAQTKDGAAIHQEGTR